LALAVLIMASFFGWFTEGLDTLKEVKALLDELAS